MTSAKGQEHCLERVNLAAGLSPEQPRGPSVLPPPPFLGEDPRRGLGLQAFHCGPCSPCSCGQDPIQNQFLKSRGQCGGDRAPVSAAGHPWVWAPASLAPTCCFPLVTPRSVTRGTCWCSGLPLPAAFWVQVGAPALSWGQGGWDWGVDKASGPDGSLLGGPRAGELSPRPLLQGLFVCPTTHWGLCVSPADPTEYP